MEAAVNKPTDPYDPHHVVMNLMIDLQSTNLVRQKEILRLREENGKLRVISDEHYRAAQNRKISIDGIRTFVKTDGMTPESKLAGIQKILEDDAETEES